MICSLRPVLVYSLKVLIASLEHGEHENMSFGGKTVENIVILP